MEIISIISIVSGVLSIILFFKIWGMTNDIDAIRIKYFARPRPKTFEEFAYDVFVLYSKGKKDQAIEMIDKEAESDLKKYMFMNITSKCTEQQIDKEIEEKVIKPTKVLYSILGEELPEYYNNLTKKNLNKFMNTIEVKTKEG